MIYTSFATPAAPSEVVKRLKQVDPRLDLKYVAWPSRDGANMNLSHQWAIIQRWREDDTRRRMIQLGQMSDDSDFDVITYLPIEVSTEEAFGYFERSLRGQFQNNSDINHFLQNLHKWNVAAQKEVLKPVMEHAEEMIEANVGQLFGEDKKIPKVFVSDGGAKAQQKK